MKNRLIVPILLLGVFLCACNLPALLSRPTASATAPQPGFSFPAWGDRASFRDGLSPSSQPILGQLPDATEYHLDLNLNDDLLHATGVEDIRYVNRTGAALDDIVLRLYSNLLGGRSEIVQSSVNGGAIAPSLSAADSVLRLPLAAPLEAGQAALIHLSFKLTIPNNIHTSYGIFAYTDGVLSLAHAYPMVAVHDGKGWNEEIPSPWGDVLYNETCFYSVRIEAPSNLILAATGREVFHQSNGTRQQAAFADGPARDFYLAASADYVRTSKSAAGITINSYAPHGDEAMSRQALDVASAALQDFSSRYAPYPYAEFDLVAIPTQALGIEYPGLVAILSDLYRRAAAGDNRASQTIEFTVAHETGHQWFYNLVGNNQLDEPWLDESLTQFATWQYYVDRYGPSAAETFKSQDLQGNWNSIQDAAIPIGEPVAAYTESQYVGIIYGRGPFFFMALDQQIGQQEFDLFLRDYVHSYAWGIASADGLKAVAEKDCGCNLTPIFQTWVYP